MPVTLSGVASGMNTDAIIDKLLKVEARPIRQLETRKKEYVVRKDALKKLHKHVAAINAAVKELYGFRASYNDKKVLSSDPSILTATVTRKADIGERKIKINRIASAHKIATDAIDKDASIPAARFWIKINNEERKIKFGGGSLKALKEKIDDNASDLITSSYINTSGNKYILTLQSRISGKKGEIHIRGDRSFLKRIGLAVKALSGKKRSVRLTFDRKYLLPYTGAQENVPDKGALSVSANGATLKMTGSLWREYTLPVAVTAKQGTELKLSCQFLTQEEKKDTGPDRIETGPRDGVNIQGIELKGYNVSRLRQRDREALTDGEHGSGIGIITEDGGKRIERIYPLPTGKKNGYTINVGKDFSGKRISKLIFYTRGGKAHFSNAALITPISGKNGLVPKNSITAAEDALISVDGIQITRDKNNGLTNIVKGATLNLLRPSQKEVSLTIDHNPDPAIKKIKAFVEAYNKYIDFYQSATKAEKVTKPGEFKKMKRKKGILMGNMTVIRLENLLKMVINAPYPNRAEKQIKLLTQMGVSTGAINSNWQSIKLGKLIINESKLRDAILNNPEGVKMFFGSDRDGDNRIDTGMAYKMEYVLKPYISPGRNIIASQIGLEDVRIKEIDKEIIKQGDHLKQYEERLRSKFARMERAISESKTQRNWMNQQFGGGGGGGGQKGKAQ